MFEERKRKPVQRQAALKAAPVQPRIPAAPIQRAKTSLGAWPSEFTKSAGIQRQIAAPALQATALHTQEVSRVNAQVSTLQRQMAEFPAVSAMTTELALQRQATAAQRVPPPLKPQSTADWVTVMRFQAEQADGRRMQARESMQFTALQRQIAQTLTQHYLTDRQPPLRRQQEYAQHVATLQRHPLSGLVGQVFMRSVPAGERPALQRAVDEVLQREALQQQQDEQALELHGLQRQLAEVNAEAATPVFERIQSRRGAGNPLSEAVQRHLEQGLNHDLSTVRIHDDAEADKLAKGVNAIAFTTGADIFFQSGKFNPNTQSGMELLAHEVTHTVQQAKGQVGKSIDPDSGLEAEARTVGRTLAKKKFNAGPLRAKSLPKQAPLTVRFAVQRAPAATPPSWNTTANPAMLEQMLQKNMDEFLRNMLGKTLRDQTYYDSKNRNTPQATPSIGKTFLDSVDHLPISAASKQKVLEAAIQKPMLPDDIRLEIAKTAAYLKRVDVAKTKATMQALQTKIETAASKDHILDFGKAVGSRLWDTVVGIFKLAKFAAWDNSAIRMLVDFPGYKKMWVDIGQTGAAIVQNPGLIWEAMTKDAKDAWKNGDYGKSLGYITFDVASIATGVPGAAKAAASVPGKMRVVVAIAKDMKGNMVTKVSEVGDGIAQGMQMTANDMGMGGRPNLATANARTSPQLNMQAPSNTPQGIAARNNGALTPTSGVPVASAARVAGSLADPLTLKGLVRQLNLAQRCGNWSEVAKIIGKKASPTTLPQGYKYAKIPLEGGGYDQFAYLADAKSIPQAVPKLKADAQGNWQPTGLDWVKKKDGTYTVSRDYRLAQSSEYNAANPVPDGFEGLAAVNNHHMIPDSIMRGSPLFQQMFAKGLLSPDRATNMINLAVDANTLAELRAAGYSMSDITHYTSHPKYDALVRSTLEAQVQQWQGAGKLPLDLSTATPKQMMQFTDSFDRYMRRHFFQDAQKLKKVLRPNGSLGAAPSHNETEVA